MVSDESANFEVTEELLVPAGPQPAQDRSMVTRGWSHGGAPERAWVAGGLLDTAVPSRCLVGPGEGFQLLKGGNGGEASQWSMSFISELFITES